MNKYHSIINDTNYCHNIRNAEQHWERIRDEILEYLDDKTQAGTHQRGRQHKGSLSTYVHAYNKFNTCSYYGYKQLWDNLPQWLFLELYQLIS